MDHRDNLIGFYDANAAQRDTRPVMDHRLGLRESFLGRLQDSGATKLIEFGAGTGKDSLFFHEHGLQVLATDLSPEHVKHCREKGIPAEVADYYDLPFDNDSFDAGWAMSTFLHVPDADLGGVLSEVKRVLRPGAPMGVGLWGGRDFEGIWIEDDDPKRFYSLRAHDRVQELFSAVFEVIEFEPMTIEGHDDADYQWMVVTA